MAEKKIEELTYKEASQELERIIRALESGEMELEQTSLTYHAWRDADDLLAEATGQAERMAERAERLRWMLEDLEALSPRKGEWDELNAEHTRLAHGYAIAEGLNEAALLLTDGDDSASERLSSAYARISSLLRYDPELSGIGESLGYKPKSREMNGLFLAALTGVRTVGPLFISACVIGYALLAFYPEDVQAHFNMVNWFIAALPWFVFVTVVNFAVIVLMYGPKGERARLRRADAAAEEAGSAPKAHPAEENDLGPMSVAEKKMLVIILATVALWVLEPLHGIPSVAVGLAGVAAFLGFRVCTLRAFRASLNWESLLFIGTAMGLATVFSYTGIDTWVVELVGPVMQHLAFSPFTFVVGVALATVALRFIIASEMAFINIFMAFMAPMAVSLGINPWVVGFAVYAMVNPWFMMYQNPIYMAAFYSVDGRMVNHGPMAAYCGIYLAICLAGLLLSIPYWMATGIYAL